MNLKRSVNTTSLLFVAVAGIMGSGWLFGPFYAVKVAGPAAVLSWIIGGGLMMLIALTFAELASTFPVAGGTVRFLQLSHGPFASYTMAWISWLSNAAVAPIETIALLQYASNYLPWLMYKSGSVYLLTLPGLGVAAGLMLIMVIINAYGVKLLSKTNNIVVLFKLGVPLITILLLLILDFHPHNMVSHGFAPYGFKGILEALPTAGIIFAFIGYSPAIQLAGEARNPQRSVPIAILGGLLLCILIYFLLQMTFVASLNPQSFAAGWSHLTFQKEAGPFAGVFISIGLAWWAGILYLGAAVSPFGTALIYTASTARLTYAMGENGYMPKTMQVLNRQGVPVRLIILNYLIGLLLFLPFPSWQSMVTFLVAALVFAYAVGPLALVVLRKTLPHQPRPFKLPAYRWLSLLAFYVCNLIVFWTGWHTIYKIIIAIAIGYVALAIYKLTPSGRKLQLYWEKAWWLILYIAGLGLVSYLGSFGGGRDIIPFGWDFLVIAVGTWVIFELALFLGLRTDYQSQFHTTQDAS